MTIVRWVGRCANLVEYVYKNETTEPLITPNTLAICQKKTQKHQVCIAVLRPYVKQKDIKCYATL
jgi:hypothetical protein